MNTMHPIPLNIFYLLRKTLDKYYMKSTIATTALNIYVLSHTFPSYLTLVVFKTDGGNNIMIEEDLPPGELCITLPGLPTPPSYSKQLADVLIDSSITDTTAGKLMKRNKWLSQLGLSCC